MANRTAAAILDEADELLKTARFGLEDMMTRPGRARTGLRNAVVFGRNATWALQNLRGVVSDFDVWYEGKAAEMSADPLMKYFAKLRNKIEKQASTPTTVSAYIASFSTRDIERLKPAPPGAVGFFIGDQNGGSGWRIKKPNGREEAYYVELPNDKVVVTLHLSDASEEIAKGRSAAQVVDDYLSKVATVLEEARARFAA
jgi:hypothetical protein